MAGMKVETIEVAYPSGNGTVKAVINKSQYDEMPDYYTLWEHREKKKEAASEKKAAPNKKTATKKRGRPSKKKTPEAKTKEEAQKVEETGDISTLLDTTEANSKEDVESLIDNDAISIEVPEKKEKTDDKKKK